MARLACCLAALAAAAVVSTASGAGCASDAYCAAQPGCDQPDLVTCLESVCYTGTVDARCDGRDCGFDLGDGGWCCDGRRDSMCCTQLTSVQRDLCEWHSVVGGGGTAINAAGLDACRAWCDAEASCFAIQWVSRRRLVRRVHRLGQLAGRRLDELLGGDVGRRRGADQGMLAIVDSG